MSDFEEAREAARAAHPELSEKALDVFTVLRPLFPEAVALAQAIRQGDER